MGVRGLTTYISEHQSQCLRPHELCECYLVIDGQSLACNLYGSLVKNNSAFGGDYDEYYKIVKDFFLLLKKCAVTPIVLLDGGRENKKIKTVLKRFNEKLEILRNFSRRFSNLTFFPIFMKQTLLDVLEDLEITFIQCDAEADAEIAAVARALKCPVLSNDSDFFIFDVLYIPFSSLQMTAIKYPIGERYYLRCSLYNVNNLLKQFPGLDKSTLPIIATLLGNDYINSSLFQKFFNHVIMPKSRSLSYTQKKIDGVFRWMQKENSESAIKLILTHLENKMEGVFLKAIRTSIDDYTSSFVSESVLDELITRLGKLGLNKKEKNLSLPVDTLPLYRKGKIDPFIIDLINLGVFMSALQVEDVHGDSPHTCAIQLILDIHKLIAPYKKQEGCLQMYVLFKNWYGCAKIEYNSSACLDGICLADILKESKEVRLELFCKITGVSESELSIVSANWSVFIVSYIYWARTFSDQLSFSHHQALILMAIANEAVQKHVGYFRNIAKFTKHKGNLLSSSNSTVPIGTSQDFEGMLGDITLYEKLLLTRALIPHRRSDHIVQYCLRTVHLFACFQGILFYIMQLNALLNHPLPHMKVSDFYSGTLAFNLYMTIKISPPFEKFLGKFFKDTPNLHRLYDYLHKCLCKYSLKTASQVKKKKKKGKQTKKGREKPEEEEEGFVFCQIDGNDDDYNDENNLYAILQTVKND